jgi:WD40 repeat protein
VATGSKRYLIAVGSPGSPGQRFLPYVERDVKRISELLCDPSQGYERILGEAIPLGTPAPLIRDTILNWFTHQDRNSSDLVILYFAGHGGDAGRAGNYYLFTSDTDDKQPSKTAINVGRFVQELYEGQGEVPQSLLLILDACYSGKGAAEAVTQSAPIRQQGGFREGAGLWVVATADSLSQADDGVFIDAMFDVFKDPAWTPSGGAEYLNPIEVLVYGVNEWFLRNEHIQRAEWEVLGNRTRPLFLRNPQFTEKLDGVPLLDESHWDPKARGVEDTVSTGWFFTGRRRALQALVSWLNAPVSDFRARVVTGGPGSGKSAVLARLITSANPAKRAKMIATGILDTTDGTVPAEGGIDAYVHSRNLSAAAIAAAIAEQLSISAGTMEGLLSSLAERKKLTTIVVDALDEAQDARESEFLFLRKLTDSPAVRLIVGTRKQGDYVPMAGKSEVIDLDDEQYFDRADVVQYVFERLTAKNSTSPYTYPSEHKNARNIAELAGDRAGFSFLIARIVARKLAAAPTPIDTRLEGWMTQVSIPADLHAAFALDLDRFSAVERTKFIDLLVPLAWARGKGLPQKSLWAALASSIAGRTYANTDIEDLKRVAGYYLIQDTENEEVVYRLFHESFAEYLRAESREKKADEHFSTALQKLAESSSDGKTLWSRVFDEYTLHYLPAHAAASGDLDKLVGDVDFLFTFSPESLLPYLRSVQSSEALAITRCYRAVIHHLRKEPLVGKVSYLLLSAIQYGADGIVGQLRALTREVGSPWRFAWAAWTPWAASEVVIQSDKPISSFTYVEDQKRAAFVVGLDDCVVVYDAFTARELIRSQPLDIKIEFLASLKDGENIWIVVGGLERGAGRVASLVTLRYPSCEVHKKRKEAHSGWEALRSFCPVEGEGRPMVATGGSDLALRLWSIPDLSLVSESTKADFAAISKLIAVRLANRSVLVCGGDAVNPDGDRSADGVSVFFVGVPGLERIGTAYGDQGGYVKFLVPIILDGSAYVLAKFEHEGLKLLEVSTAKLVASTTTELGIFGCLRQTSSSFLILGEHWGRLHALELRLSSHGDGNDVKLLPPNAGIEAKGSSWQGPLHIASRNTIAGVDANQLRLWEIEDLIAAKGSIIGEEDLTAAIGIRSEDKTYVITADRGGSIIVRDGEAGKHLNTIHIKYQPLDYATSIAVTMLQSKPIFILSTSDGYISVFDMASGELLRTFRAGRRVNQLTSCVIGGSSFLFAATNVNQEGAIGHYVITAWDLASGDEILLGPDSIWEESERRLALSDYEDKTFSCLATAEDRGKTILCAAGPYSFVRAWYLENDKAEKIGDYWITPHRGNEWIEALATGALDGRAVVAAGNEKGILVVWDTATRKELAKIYDAHRGAITALVFLNNNRGLVTSGKDGILRVWSNALEPIQQIDIEHKAFSLSMLGNADNRVVVATRLGVFVLELNY